MRVTSAAKDTHYYSKAEIAEQIRRSSALPTDDLWISGESEYPCLAILINGQFACMHYFENSSGTMFQSIGSNSRHIAFIAGGEEWEAPESSVVTLEEAIACIEEFCDTLKRPVCIQWQEL